MNTQAAPTLYKELHRPQFHFTSQRYWINDPNGLVYYAGEWHLFFQHNPYGIKWGNMTWGHAVSPDLVHWTQLPNALEPDALGTIYSGSAVVDWANTAGMQTGAEPPLIAIYTSAGSEAKPPVPFTQSIAGSNDRGRTWTKHSGNPVLGHIVGANRDPKVIWHAPSAQWVMALYLDGNDYALFGSPNLRDWTRLCDVAMPGVAECPDFFPLPVDGAATRTLWVFWGAAGCYRLGAFDGVDMTLMTHQSTRDKPGLFSVGGPSNGCLVKQVRYEGVAAHAGGSPHDGVNALRAAMLAMQAIDANRETFKDDDHIRVHPIITKGGELVNVIPADVRLETYVRGASVEAIMAAAKKVDRSLRSGAMAMGATAHISTLPGYLPRIPADALTAVYRENAVALVGEEGWWEPSFGAGSTDMGDVSHLMPAIEAQAKGSAGTGHGADYRISDPEAAYITPAKVAAGTLIDLLANGAERAKQVLAAYQPAMSKDGYLEFMRGLFREEHWKAAEEG